MDRINNCQRQCCFLGDGYHLRLLLTQLHFGQQTSSTMLELSVLGGVDERVDDAVAKHQNHAEVVVPRSKVDVFAEEADCVYDLERSVTDEESTANNQ